MQVDGLMEDMEVTSGNVQRLKWDLKELVKQINQTARNSRILFMETGLEVEAAREAVLRQVGELAGNLSHQALELHELEIDLNHLYKAFYNKNDTTNCDCKGLKAAVAQLEQLANDNRVALEAIGTTGTSQWASTTDWEPAVEALQRGLQQV